MAQNTTFSLGLALTAHLGHLSTAMNAGIFDTKKTTRIVFSSTFYRSDVMKINKKSLHIITISKMHIVFLFFFNIFTPISGIFTRKTENISIVWT